MSEMKVVENTLTVYGNESDCVYGRVRSINKNFDLDNIVDDQQISMIQMKFVHGK